MANQRKSARLTITSLTSLVLLVLLSIMLQAGHSSAVEHLVTQEKNTPALTDSVHFEIMVSSVKELREALQNTLPGTIISIAPGLYSSGIYMKDVHGSPDSPIVVTGADPENPPVFMGYGEGAKLSSCSFIKLANMTFQGFTKNGMNIDDGGKVETSSHHIILDNITVLDIGPKGNRDALKMSGVDHFIVRNSQFKGWGGSGIDMVGCHNGVVENCRFIGVDGYRTANGIQVKGGSRSILVQNSFFENAGERVVHIGGSTGKQYFRPARTSYEAKDVTVAGNTFVGGEAQVAWITAQESHVHHNLFYLPTKWVGRILQETKDPMFKPSQNGLFENNMVITDNRVRTFFNIGRRTKPSSFVFRTNAWFNPQGKVVPSLPTPEKDGIYDLDPGIVDKGDGVLIATSADPRIKNVGPWNYSPWVAQVEFGDITLKRVLTPAPPPPSTSKSSLTLVGSLVVIGLLFLGYFGYRALRPVQR